MYFKWSENHIDAIQLLSSCFTALYKVMRRTLKVVVDSERYMIHRFKSIIYISQIESKKCAGSST